MGCSNLGITPIYLEAQPLIPFRYRILLYVIQEKTSPPVEVATLIKLGSVPGQEVFKFSSFCYKYILIMILGSLRPSRATYILHGRGISRSLASVPLPMPGETRRVSSSSRQMFLKTQGVIGPDEDHSFGESRGFRNVAIGD